MTRTASHVLVFIVGFAICAFILYSLYGVPVGKSPAAVSPILKAPGRSARIADDPIPAAVQRLAPSVVSIDTVGTPRIIEIPEFFGFRFNLPLPAEPPKGKASGVILSRDGYILTNNHVVQDARTVTITLWNGKQYSARIVGTDAKSDLAVLKINARDLPAATFGDSSKLRVGDWVIAIGNALGLGPTVTVGVVSASARSVPIEPGKVLENAVQTDASINRGNSGGALADVDGNVVGINTAIASTSPGGGSIGIGFAIPSNTAAKIASELIKKGKVERPPRPWVGIGYEPITDQVRAGLHQMGMDVPRDASVIIVQVYPNSPADKAGLRRYDIVLELNGRKVKDPDVIKNEVLKLKVGQTVNLLIWRSGAATLIPVKVGPMPEEIAQPR